MKKKLLITSVLFAFICINTVNASITKKNKSNTVYVDIKGAVKSPGVYQVSKNARVIDVIKKAGMMNSFQRHSSRIPVRRGSCQRIFPTCLQLKSLYLPALKKRKGTKTDCKFF